MYTVGVKEVWDVPEEKHTGGRVIHTLGWPLRNEEFGERRCCEQRLNGSEINFQHAEDPCRGRGSNDERRDGFGARMRNESANSEECHAAPEEADDAAADLPVPEKDRGACNRKAHSAHCSTQAQAYGRKKNDIEQHLDGNRPGRTVEGLQLVGRQPVLREKNALHKVLPVVGIKNEEISRPALERELHRGGTTHRVAQHERGRRAEVVEQLREPVGHDRHAHFLPRQRVAAAEPGQARVDHPQSEPAGEARALAPVHAAAREEAVHVERPLLGLEVVGH